MFLMFNVIIFFTKVDRHYTYLLSLILSFRFATEFNISNIIKLEMCSSFKILLSNNFQNTLLVHLNCFSLTKLE